MRGDEVIPRGDIVVRDNRIVAVGPSGSVELPDGADVRDMTGKTIYPGLVDIHAHTWVAWGVHRGQVSQFLAQLAYGVTTTRDPQTAFTDILSYTDRVLTGGMTGPRIYSTGPGVFNGENIRDADHAKTVLRRYSEYYDTKTLKMYMSGNRQQRQWIIQAARELELMPTTEGGLDYKIDMTHAIDGYPGIEHNIPVAPMPGITAVPFTFKRSSDLYTSGGGYESTTETAHGLVRLEADRLVIQWRVAVVTESMEGSGYETHEEIEPVREIVIPLAKVAGAFVPERPAPRCPSRCLVGDVCGARYKLTQDTDG
jgi:hypothetical protein